MRPFGKKNASRQSAFTLLEMIVVIVLLGVLAGGAGLLITTPIEAYSDQVRRTRLVDQAEMALRQVARDVRNALPNSIRISAVGSGWALEMVNTVDGARYRDQKEAASDGDEVLLSFVPAGDSDFNFLGKLSLASFASNHRIVIYNTSAGDIYADAVKTDNSPGVITPAGSTLTLSASATYTDEHHVEISPAFEFIEPSPGQRAFIVDGPITYICDPVAGRIMRYSSYPYQGTQQTSGLGGLAGVQSGPVAQQVSACSLEYEVGTSQRGDMVTMGITIEEDGELVTLLHQIHVVNAP